MEAMADRDSACRMVPRRTGSGRGGLTRAMLVLGGGADVFPVVPLGRSVGAVLERPKGRA